MTLGTEIGEHADVILTHSFTSGHGGIKILTGQGGMTGSPIKHTLPCYFTEAFSSWVRDLQPLNHPGNHQMIKYFYCAKPLWCN